jgi:hypothetical protein
MNTPSILAVLIASALSVATVAAQDAPRLDGSNVPQQLPVVTLAPPPADTQVNSQNAHAATAPQASHGKSKTSPAAAAPVILIPPPPPTPADLPPVAATINFSNGLLTVHAHNASLEQILRDTSQQTGMQMEGTPQDQRIFGDFGPAPVPVVLGQLLDGGPSNYVLFGKNANMAPRSLVITPKSSLAPGQVAGIGKPAVTVNNEDDEDDDAPPVTNPQPGVHPIMPNHAPGNQDQSGGPPGAHSPQQIIDDLQRRRQEQQTLPGSPSVDNQ